jgi:hypothetical protein
LPHVVRSAASLAVSSRQLIEGSEFVSQQ